MTACAACATGALRGLADALAADDIDRALTLGLLENRPEERADLCAECQARACIVIDARDERLHALAARKRFRARQARLAGRAEASIRKQSANAAAPHVAASQQVIATAPSLPPAAAAALARAKVRVAAKTQPE